MLKRMLNRWMLMNEAGGVDTGGAPAPSPAPAPLPDADGSATLDAGLTPPESLLNEKPEGESKPEEVKPEEKPVDDKPIEYKDFTLPEGLTLDAEKLGAFKTIAAEAKLPQEVAQKFVDMYSAEMKALSEAPMRAWTEMQTKWQDEVRNDPEIGGKNLDKNLAATKTGLKNLLGEQAQKFFDALSFTGAGNNPDIIRGLIKAAAPHAPASPVAGRPAGGTKSAGSTLYPSMNGLGNGHEG